MLTPRFTINNSITRDLTTIERARGFLEAATLSEDWVRQMSQRALLLEAHHTTQIEGTRLTLDQSRQLWAGESVSGTDVDDVRELLNYRAAFELVVEHAAGDQPISEILIREIHRRLVTGVRGEAAQPGMYRITQNFIANSRTGEVVYTPPPPGDVPDLMRELVEWLRFDTAVHPVLIAGIAQFQLVHIHPFVDGNGRTSRLLSTVCLYRAGYDFRRLFTLSEYYDRNRPAFYTALQGVRERDLDLTGWLEYFVDGLAKELTEVKQRGEVAIRTDVVARRHRLNARQAAAITWIQTHGTLAISGLFGQFPEITRRTLQRDLKSLVERGLLLEISTGTTDPNRHYVLGKGTSGHAPAGE
ncbi:MAG: Fic family protein [Planctomycetota bacterium]|nr:Fic family protein [Planctomycetota bacterium]